LLPIEIRWKFLRGKHHFGDLGEYGSVVLKYIYKIVMETKGLDGLDLVYRQMAGPR